MSWAEGEWKVGLPGGALCKIESLEQQVDRLQRERQQRQVQLDTLQQTLDKQKRKQEEEKASYVQLERERQNLLSQLEEHEHRQVKLQQELSAKDKQLRCLEAHRGTSQAVTESPLPVAPRTPASSRFQSHGSSLDAPATPFERQLQNRVRELEAQLKGSFSEARPSVPPSTPQRGQATDRENHAMDRLRVENSQLVGKVSELEQKSRQLSQQLECQNHNSDAARRALEQRSRQREAELKEEMRLQAQESNKLLKELGESQSRLQQELTSSQKELGVVKAQLERSQAQVVSQDRTVGELRQQVASLGQQEQQGSSQLAEAQRSLRQQEQMQRGLEARCETLEARGREAASSLESSNKDLRARETELHKCSIDLEQRERDVAQLQNQLANAKSQMSALEQQKHSVEQKLTQSQTDLQREAAHSKDVSARLASAEEKLVEQKKAADRQNVAMEQLRSELAKAQRESANALAKLQTLESAVQRSSDSAREFSEKAACLERQLADALRDNEASRASGEALAKSLKQKDAERASLLDSKKEIEGQLNDVAKLAEHLASELNAEQNKAAELEAVVAEGREASARFAKLREDLEAVTCLLKETERAMKQCEREKAEAMSLLEQQKKECKRAMSAQEALKATEVKLAEYEQKVRALEGSVSEGKAEKDALLMSLQERESALREMEKEFGTLQRRVADLETELREVRETLSRSDAQLGSKEDEARQREAELQKMEGELQETVEKVLGLERTCGDLGSMLEARNSEISTLRESLGTKDAAVTELEARLAGIAEMETQLQRLHTEKRELEGQLSRLELEKASAMAELNKHLTRQAEEHSRVVRELDCANSKLEEQEVLLHNQERKKDDLLAAHLNAEEELASLRQVAANMEALQGSLAAAVEEKRLAVDTLEDEAEQLRQTVQELLRRTEELSVTEVRVTELEAALTASEAQLEERTSEAEKLRCSVASLLARDKEAEELCHSLCERNQELDVALLDSMDLRARLQEQEKETSDQLRDLLAHRLASEAEQLALQEALARERARLSASEEGLTAAKLDYEAQVAERSELEHMLVERNGELDEKLLELAAAQEQLVLVSTLLSEREEELKAEKQSVSEKTGQLEELRERCTATVEQLSTACSQLQEARILEARLREQLEERDLAVAELRQEAVRLCDIEALSAELMHKLAAVEQECDELQQLRHELVKCNGERDELHLSLLECREELLDKNHRLEVAVMEIGARDATLEAQAAQLSRHSAREDMEERPSREGGDAGIAAVLLDVHCATLSCLEDRSKALKSLQVQLEKEQRRSAEEPLGEASQADDLGGRIAKLVAEREALEQRLRSVKSLASEAIDKMRMDMEALSGVIRDAWDSTVSSKAETTPEVHAENEAMGDAVFDNTLDRTNLSYRQPASVGDPDTTDPFTCELTSSSERSSSDGRGEQLENKLARVCRLLGVLRLSVHELVDQARAPAPPLGDPTLLSYYASEIEREYAVLRHYLALLQQRVFRKKRHGTQSSTIDVHTELHLAGDDLVEASASILVTHGPMESIEEDQETFLSFEDEETTGFLTPESEGDARRELEETVERQRAEKQQVGSGLLEIWHGLGSLLRLVETVPTSEDEASEEMHARAKCRDLCRHLRDWFSNFVEFLSLVGKVRTELDGALGGRPLSLPDPSAFSLPDVSFLEAALNSAFLEKDASAEECSALRMSLAQREVAERCAEDTLASLESEHVRREEEVRLLRIQVAALEQSLTKMVEPNEWLAEKEALLKKLESQKETVGLLNCALEEVEETLQATCNEKEQCQRNLVASKEEAASLRSAHEQAQVQLAERVAFLEGELAAKKKLADAAESAACALEEEGRKLVASLELHKVNLAEGKANESLLREKVMSLTETVAALETDLEVELASREALRSSLLTSQGELAHCHRELEMLQEEKRDFSLRRDEDTSELAKLRGVFAQVQEEHGSQLQQLSEEKNGLFVEVNELREKCSQVMAEKERLEEEKRAVLRQAEEQEQELLSADALRKENGTLLAEVERLAIRLDEAKGLQARVYALEEERELLKEKVGLLSSLENCVEQLKARLSSEEQQRLSLEEQLQQLSTLVQEMDALRQHKSHLEKDLLDLKSKLEEAEDQAGKLPELQQRLGSLEITNAELSGQVETLKDRNRHQLCELEQLMRQLECLQASAEESSGSLQVLRGQFANEEAKTALLVAQAKQHAIELCQCQEKLRAAEDQTRKLSLSRLTLESRLCSQEAERIALSLQVKECTAECEIYQTEARAMEDKVCELTSLKSSLESKLAREEAKTAEFAATLAEFEISCREHQSRLRAAEDLSRELSASRSDVEANLSEARSAILELEERYLRVEEENRQLQSGVQERDLKLENVCDSLVRAREELQKNDQLHIVELEKLRALQSSLEQKLVQAVGDAEALRHRCESLESSKEILVQEVDAHSLRVEQLERSLEALEHRRHLEEEQHVADMARASSLKLEQDESLQLKEAEKGEVQARLLELETVVMDLRAKLSTSESQCDELGRKASAALAAAKQEEHHRRILDAELKRLHTKLGQAEAELGQIGDSSKLQEEELERTRQELSKCKESEVEAWARVSSLCKELQRSKESVTWLRTRMRDYKQRIADLDKTEPPNLEDKKGGDPPLRAKDTRKMLAPCAPAVASPVVTRLSLRSQSPSKARLCLTVSAVRQSSASSTPKVVSSVKGGSGKVPWQQPVPSSQSASSTPKVASSVKGGSGKAPWQQPVPSGQSTSTSKRSLFADVPTGVQVAPTVEVNPPSKEELGRARSTHAGVVTRNRRHLATQDATPTHGKQQRSRLVGESPHVACQDKENQLGEVCRSQKPGVRPRTRKRKQELEEGSAGTPLGRDSANIHPRGDTATPSESTASLLSAQAASPRAPTRELRARGAYGMTTRARQAAAPKSNSESKDKDPENCKMQ